MLQIGEFNSSYIFPLLHKLLQESSKQFFLVTLMLDYLNTSHLNLSIVSLICCLPIFLLPQIILPTRISSLSTLIDNIFWNLTHTTKSISDELTSTVFDQLPQILSLIKKNSSLNLIAEIGI